MWVFSDYGTYFVRGFRIKFHRIEAILEGGRTEFLTDVLTDEQLKYILEEINMALGVGLDIRKVVTDARRTFN
jgi:hypothetical protein